MSKLLLVVGSLILPAAFWIGSCFVQPSQPVAPVQVAAPVEWRWSDEKATLAYSIKQQLPDYDVELVQKEKLYTPINIRTKDGKRLVYHLEDGHKRIVFTRSKDILYIAEFGAISSGCEVVAIDLTTGKLRWKSDLQGIGPTKHSEYENSVNIETDGDKVIIYGNESNGRYVEHLDIKSGKMLLNRKFDAQ